MMKNKDFNNALPANGLLKAFRRCIVSGRGSWCRQADEPDLLLERWNADNL
jgi:hypothetical protein